MGGFPGSSVLKNPPASAEGTGLIPESRRSLGKGNGNPFQYSCLGNPMDREVWPATVHVVPKSQTQPSNTTTTTTTTTTISLEILIYWYRITGSFLWHNIFL